MKKSILTTLLLLVSMTLPFAGVNAEEPTAIGSSTLVRSEKASDKRRVPSSTRIVCEVFADMIVFEANFDYEIISVSLSDENGITNATITPFEPFIISTLLPGTTYITCTTETGTVYSGELTL